jgi:hypothetical protein
MSRAVGQEVSSLRRPAPPGPPDVKVRQLTAAVHIGLIAALVLLVGVRLLGFSVGLTAEFGVVALVLVSALVVAFRPGSVGRE